MTHFTLIGLSDDSKAELSDEIIQVISLNNCFSGGIRHHKIVAPYLKEEIEWIDIKSPISETFEQYRKHEEIIVFVSGDPLFFGLGGTIRRLMPQAAITVFPTFNSIQMLAHRLLMPYQHIRMVSLTGRPWHEFDRALIENAPLIGVLTDGEHTPVTIAKRMLEYNFTHYKMNIGVQLGNDEKEQITRSLALTEMYEKSFDAPNCLILERMDDNTSYRQLGIPDRLFEHLDGREKMITKAPIRVLDLSYLQLDRCNHFWDIGFCTGSVSIEAKTQYPHLHIQAFEIRPECKELMDINTRRLKAPGIEVNIGDFLQKNLTVYPSPDAVFIGGHGGKLKEIIHHVAGHLAPDGIIVFNSVSDGSYDLFESAVKEEGLVLKDRVNITVDSYNPITILSAIKPI